MKKSIIAFSCLALLFGSCKKDKDENVAVTTESIAGTYSFGTVTIKSGTGAEQESTNWYEACEKDDNITLNANGSFIYTDAGVRCDPAGDDTGNWSFANNNTKINIDGSGEMNIVSFDGRVLKIGETDNSTGTAITYTITLNKQ